jgi:hypothetical protein
MTCGPHLVVVLLSGIFLELHSRRPLSILAEVQTLVL